MEKENAMLKIVQTVNQKKSKDLKLEDITPFLNEFMSVRKVPAKGKIMREDVVIQKVYYLLKGSFSEYRSSESGKMNLMSRRQAPQFLGVGRSVDPSKADMATLIAIEDCWLLQVEKKYFVDSLMECGELGVEVIKNICDKMSGFSYRSDNIIFLNPREKLILYILEHGEESGMGRDDYVIKEKNAEIAYDIGVSIRTLQRTIKEMREEGMLKTIKGKIHVREKQIQLMKEQYENLLHMRK